MLSINHLSFSYEKNLVLDAYKEFKIKYADILSDRINDYNFKYKNRF